MIAKNELAAADYYISIGAYVGAIRRASYVIENIPNSSQNYRALKILEKSYSSLGYTDLHEDIKNILKINYSDRGSEQLVEESGWSWNFLNRSKPKRIE